jgi:hypothetical protein
MIPAMLLSRFLLVKNAEKVVFECFCEQATAFPFPLTDGGCGHSVRARWWNNDRAGGGRGSSGGRGRQLLGSKDGHDLGEGGEHSVPGAAAQSVRRAGGNNLEVRNDDIINQLKKQAKKPRLLTAG